MHESSYTVLVYIKMQITFENLQDIHFKPTFTKEAILNRCHTILFDTLNILCYETDIVKKVYLFIYLGFYVAFNAVQLLTDGRQFTVQNLDICTGFLCE